MLLWLLKISRPRFWPYVLGPYAVGVVAAGQANNWPLVILMGLYFTLPANLLIYGVNDIFDYETDKHNPKKTDYEELVTPKEQKKLWRNIGITNAPFLMLLPFIGIYALWGMAGFLFFSYFYSAPPVRAKVRPLIDSMFNVLYVFPAVVGYGLAVSQFPSPQLFIAAALWCMAMHAYSAVPDIASDNKAKISTIATMLGRQGTLLFCLLCYALSAAISYYALGYFSIMAGFLYASLMIISLLTEKRDQLFKIYTYFPYINLLVGMGLFFWVLLVAN
jgi:lycopene elongase/hydratase (dihydrobisanhydrobacterioruberin-forming)